MSFDDDPIVENMIHLNFPELLKKNFLINCIFICQRVKKNVKNDV